MKNLLVASAVVLALVSGPVLAAHTNSHVRRLANQEITKRKPELIGQTGATGPTGLNGIAGLEGPPGPAGENAVIRYARVLANGTVDLSRSSGINQANVTHPNIGSGRYCFTGLAPVKGGQVTTDYLQNSDNETAQFALNNVVGCESFVQIFVNTIDADGGFFVILY